RITVEEALAHPYLAAYHDEDDEPTHTQTFDFSFEVVESMEDMRKMIAQEVMTFKAQKQGLQLNTGSSLKRKESLSANDREALERSKEVAKTRQNDHRNSSSIAATAAPITQNSDDIGMDN
ncbi:Mitogen-activated protein kinase, partial [Rhizopus stolonifer]